METAKSRIQILNPNVKVYVDNEDVNEKPDDFFTKFSVICTSNTSTDTMVCSIYTFMLPVLMYLVV